jgi:hypothetical protein
MKPPTWLLTEPNVHIKVQIMRIVPVMQGDKSVDGDWEWTGRFEHLARATSVCEVEGQWLQFLNPVVAPPTQAGASSITTYCFLSVELVAVANFAA